MCAAFVDGINDPYLRRQQGRSSQPKWKALIISVLKEDGQDRKKQATAAGGNALSHEDWGPCGQEPALHRWQLPSWQERVVELVLLSPDNFAGNFPLLEKSAGYYPSAFLKCLTVLRALGALD